MATVKRPSLKPLPSKSDVPSKEVGLLRQRCEEAEIEVGALMSRLAKAEKEIANEKKKNAVLQASSGSLIELETLADSLDAVRVIIIAAAKDVDAFARREFDTFDSKVSILYDVKARLLAAAGQKGPPKIPAAPGKATRSKSAAPPRKLSAGVIDISEIAQYLESLRPSAPPKVDPNAVSPVMVVMPKNPRVPRIG